MLRTTSILAALCLAATSPLAAQSVDASAEPTATREHVVKLRGGSLGYTTVAGRLPIRNDESDEPRARMFYVSYSAGAKTAGRPLTFIWGGGPGGDSIALHHELMGPRIIEGDRLVDNPDTLLAATDLVFVDAVGTGFSRATKPEFASQFYTMGGDGAAMAEFIRSYLAIHGDTTRPIYLGGQSLGTLRAARVGEILAQAGYNLRGLILISGQVPGAWIDADFDDAMYIPARTEAALIHGKLDAELQRDPKRTIAEAEAWTKDVYWPALRNRKTLPPAEREEIARKLARFIGVKEQLISRKTLTMTTNRYRTSLFGSDPASTLSISDLTLKGTTQQSFVLKAALGDYFREELGYRTSIAYFAGMRGIERSFMPPPGPKPHSPTDFAWDIPPMTASELQRLADGYAPPNIPSWAQNALRANPDTRIFVAGGRLDAMVSCLGNSIMIERLGPTLAHRYTNRCYFGGHSMYRGRPETRVALLNDLKAFIGTDPNR
jgi:pimeloyl-ACP methyl ester carboxylesterase